MGDDEDGPSRALVALLQPLCSVAWVQCDHCELWRRVPKDVFAAAPAHTTDICIICPSAEKHKLPKRR